MPASRWLGSKAHAEHADVTEDRPGDRRDVAPAHDAPPSTATSKGSPSIRPFQNLRDLPSGGPSRKLR